MIRPGTRADAETVQEIAYGALRSYGMEPDIARWEAALHHFGANPPECDEFVLAEGPKVIGVGILLRLDVQTAKLSDFYIDAGYRGRGLGRLLLDHLVAHARARGHVLLRLETRHEMAAAVHLYESSGWVLERTNTERVRPQDGPNLEYSLDLASGSG
jgi:ribosomal protein S18 acetylase RimI-like enzyme